MLDPSLVLWFEGLAQQADAVPINHDYTCFYEESSASSWLTEAESALAAVFPPSHPCRTRWGAVLEHGRSLKQSLSYKETFKAAKGVFTAALNILKSDRLQTLVDGIRVQSVSELLDQAEHLLSKNYGVAAAVIAGGALESHLLYLCQKHGVRWHGDGSISKYNSAIGQARNQGTEIYSANDGKLVESWGGIRNEAAHNPGSFNRSNTEVSMMINGIRQFFSRAK